MNNNAPEDLYTLSPIQEGVLFHSLYAPRSDVYFRQFTARFSGELNAPAFREAWQRVLVQHPILRSSFHWEDLEKPLQVVHRQAEMPFALHDWRGASQAEQDERLKNFLREDHERGFALDEAPLMRLAVIRTGERDYVSVWSHHNLLLDGWSKSLVIRQVLATYDALQNGRDLALPRSRPYRDYIAWLRRRDLSQAESFWRRMLAGFDAPTPLALGGAAPTAAAERGGYGEQETKLSRELTEDLNAFARRHQLTLNTLVQGAWALLLARYSGEPDVVYGVTVSGRPPEIDGVDAMVGPFINTLPMRAEITPGDRVAGWLKGLQARQLEARQYEFSPLVEVQGWSEVPRGQKLFESIFVFENYPTDTSEQRRAGGLELLGARSVEQTNYPLTVSAEPGAELLLHISYDAARFDAETVRRMHGHLATVLAAFVADSERLLSDVSLLTEGEELQLRAWNRTAVDYPAGECLHELFEEQAAQTPEAVALVFEGVRLTYGELDARANLLARRLRAHGVGAEVMVGIMAERSIEMVVGVLGVLKAGGAYLPLDPDYPRERLSFMLEDARAALLLTQRRFAERLPARAPRVIYLDGEAEESANDETARAPRREAQSGNLAYCIYTSGSTGKPKGVLVQHSSVTNHIRWMLDAFPLAAQDCVPLKYSFSFDVSVLEIFWTLLAGARLVITRPGAQQDTAYLTRLAREQGITSIDLVPSLLEALLDEDEFAALPSLRRVTCGGEALAPELQRRFFRATGGRVGLHNMYGPTEATIGATYWTCLGGDGERRTVPIGRPVSNTEVYVLDARMRPAPVGVAGEIYIGGACLARGYMGEAAKTAEKFVPHPFASEPGARLYRTGDVGRRGADGEIEFVGRADEQVKVRGYRIELGEIEAALCLHPSVREAAVVAREDAPGDKRLVAYVVAADEPAPTAAELRGVVKERLPEYMIPSAFVVLGALPLTPNGKVDRRALPAPEDETNDAGEESNAPRTPVEEVLAGIWADVLKLERVGARDNFFALGGHSLLATRVISRMREAFGVEVSIQSLFEAPTVAELASVVGRASGAGADFHALPIGRVAREGGGELPLSYAQQGLWVTSQLDPDTPLYNIAASLRVAGRLDVAALSATLDEIVRRHETLRTIFPAVAGRPAQVVLPASGVELPLKDLRALPREEREAEAMRLATAEARRPFDLAAGPLLRATLLKLDDEDHALLFTMHHIISDGWSIGVMIEEVMALYEMFSSGGGRAPLPEPALQYADYAHWQRQWLRGEALEAQVAYWKTQLAGADPRLDLPAARPRPAVQTFNGATELWTLPLAETERLKALSRQEGVTLFMTLLAAWQTLLYRYSGQDDITVGSPVANRNRREVERIIGYFINVLALRTDLSGNPSFKELLRRVRGVALSAYAHQDLPFERLVGELQLERDPSRSALFQTVLVLQNAPVAEFKLPGLTMTPLASDRGTAHVDLYFSIAETVDGLAGLLKYNTDIYDGATVRQMLRHFELLLEEVATDPEVRLLSVALPSAGRDAGAPAPPAPQHRYGEDQFAF